MILNVNAQVHIQAHAYTAIDAYTDTDNIVFQWALLTIVYFHHVYARSYGRLYV